MTLPLLRLRRPTLAAAALVLAGCASIDADREIAQANESQRAFTQGGLALERDDAQRTARAQAADRLLAQPLAQADAVQLALANSPALQALLARHVADLAAASQSGRIANPVLSFERVRTGDELEIGRMLSFGLLDLLTLPQRQAVARELQAQQRVQLAGAVVDQVGAVRQAWVRAVAAQQSLAHARQVQQAADAGAELARRMQQAGNFSRLERARQQAFYADATARLALAQHAATATREALVRQLGLDDTQAARLRLPDRLPDLPAQPRAAQEIAGAAREQRLDWQLARLQLESAGRAQRLDLVTRLVDVEAGVIRNTTMHGGTGERSNARGWELSLRLPLFDWGSGARAQMNAQSLAAVHQLEAVSRAASSQLRESYSAYRTAWDLARHYRDEVVPLRKVISEENQLRYNGMFIGVFELLADTREQVAGVIAAIDAQQQFWLADAALSATLVGRPAGEGALVPVAGAAPAPGEAGH